MSQHTPGPWYDDDEGCIYARAREHDDEPRNRNWDIARVNFDEKYITDPPLDVACVNARLISAAPDLLAALRLLVGTGMPVRRNYVEYWAVSQAQLKIARAAIARATGE